MKELNNLFKKYEDNLIFHKANLLQDQMLNVINDTFAKSDYVDRINRKFDIDICKKPIVSVIGEGLIRYGIAVASLGTIMIIYTNERFRDVESNDET